METATQMLSEGVSARQCLALLSARLFAGRDLSSANESIPLSRVAPVKERSSREPSGFVARDGTSLCHLSDLLSRIGSFANSILGVPAASLRWNE